MTVADGLGRRIEYTLDGRGNRLWEAIKDAAGRVTRSLTRVYSRHNRLVKTRGGAGQTRLYEYDASGNLALVHASSDFGRELPGFLLGKYRAI